MISEVESIDSRPKNVPEELKNFLEANPDEWFTNEQLAERLNQYYSLMQHAFRNPKCCYQA
jgi:hypothetical protein